jgi:hypothetical protein
MAGVTASVLAEAHRSPLGLPWNRSAGRLVEAAWRGLGDTGLRRLTNDPSFGDDQPAWARGGRLIAFGRDDRIIVMNADGSDARRVPLQAGPASSPALGS